MSTFIRPARQEDLAPIVDIMNDLISTTTVIWEVTPDTFASRKQWLENRLSNGFPVIVSEQGGNVVGYGSYVQFRANCGYYRTVEHSLHVHREVRRQGLGTLLIEELIRLAREQGRHVMVGGISADNEGSIRLHRKLGFYEAGRMKEVGYKFGRWLDLVFMQKILL